MARFHIEFCGAPDDGIDAEFATRDEARDAAITMLGGYLTEHPEYAYDKHWRVDVRDESRRLLLHVIVATVDASPPLNWASLDPVR